jgi:hypothetical protein
MQRCSKLRVCGLEQSSPRIPHIAQAGEPYLGIETLIVVIEMSKAGKPSRTDWSVVFRNSVAAPGGLVMLNLMPHSIERAC